VEIGRRYASLLYDGTLDLTEMHSVSAVLLILGLPELAARAAQVAVAGACAACVWWLWRSEAPFEYRAAGLLVATLLATPYSYVYDLVLMGLAVLWLATAFHRDGWWRGDGLCLAFA